MYGYTYRFTDTMEEGRANAAKRRSLGLHTGKSAKGWEGYKRRELEQGSHEQFGAIMQTRWASERAEAVEDYRFAAYGNNLAGFGL